MVSDCDYWLMDSDPNVDNGACSCQVHQAVMLSISFSVLH